MGQHIVDESLIATLICTDAHSHGVCNWLIDHATHAVPGVTVVSPHRGYLRSSVEGICARLLGDIADIAGHGAGAIERTLRTADNLDALQVKHPQVGGSARKRDGSVVEIDRNCSLVFNVGGV